MSNRTKTLSFYLFFSAVAMLTVFTAFTVIFWENRYEKQVKEEMFTVESKKGVISLGWGGAMCGSLVTLSSETHQTTVCSNKFLDTDFSVGSKIKASYRKSFRDDSVLVVKTQNIAVNHAS